MLINTDLLRASSVLMDMNAKLRKLDSQRFALWVCSDQSFKVMCVLPVQEAHSALREEQEICWNA
jgi:hypothetical protein